MKQQIENSIYSIDIDGNVKNEKTNKLISKQINKKGYECFNLWINGKYKHFKTHRLLGLYFISNPENLPCLNHKDGNKLNNTLTNLEWCTLSYNTSHAYSLKLISRTKKFDIKTEIEIVELYKSGVFQKEIAKQFNTSQQLIYKIIKRNNRVGQNQK